MTNFLSDYAELVRGKTYKSALCSESEGIPLLGLGAIEREGGFKSSFKRYQGDTDPRTIVNSGDLFFSLKDLTQAGHLLGSVARLPESIPQGRLTQDTLKLSLSEIDPTYVYWVLRSPQARRFYKSLATGTTNLGLAREDFLSLPIPPFTTERKFTVELLERIESKIELNQKMNQTLEDIAKAIFKSWFVDFDPVRAKAEDRPTGLPPEISDLFPDELVDSEIGEIPEGWGIGNLKSVSSNRSKSVKPDQMANFSSYVGLEHLPRGHIFLSNWGNPSEVESNKTVFEQGDILFGKLRPYFEKSVIAPTDGVCSTDIVAIEPNANTQIFVACLVSQRRFFEFTSQGSTGTRMPRTSWKHMCEFEFAVPSDQLLQQFQSMISSLVERAMIGISESETLSELRDTLLPRLISGELRIPDAEKFLEEAGI